MFRQLLSRVLHADLEPAIDWSETEKARVLARQSVSTPLPFGRTVTLEEVLCSSGDTLLYTKWQRSGAIRRIRCSQKLEARELRITEWLPAPNAVYRLQLSPVPGSPVIYDMSLPTWFGLWRNEPTMDDLGSGICFFDSSDREYLVKLRAELLNGEVPEPLRNEEVMWQKMNALPEADRRAALATLVMQQQAENDRRFQEAFPEIGPVPDELRPLQAQLEMQMERIRQTADDRPVAPELAKLMQQFTREINDRAEQTKPRE